MDIRRNGQTGQWEVVGLTTDQLFDIHEAAILYAQVMDSRDVPPHSRRRQTMTLLMELVMAATEPAPRLASP